MIKQELEKGKYNKFKDYVLQHGVVPNGDSCIVVDIGNCDITLCLSDTLSAVRVCEGYEITDGKRSRELSNIELDNKFQDLLQMVKTDITDGYSEYNYISNDDFIC